MFAYTTTLSNLRESDLNNPATTLMLLNYFVFSRGIKDRTLMHNAAQAGNCSMIDFLLKEDTNKTLISAPDEKGFTPLHLAAKYGQIEAAATLLKNGADVNCQDSTFWTPLHLAVANNDLAMAALLITYNANLEQRSAPLQETSLLLAASVGNKEMLELLLNAGADITVQDLVKDTVLHNAVRIALKTNDSTAANYLTQQYFYRFPDHPCADLEIKNELFHQSPLDEINEAKNEEIKIILLSGKLKQYVIYNENQKQKEEEFLLNNVKNTDLKKSLQCKLVQTRINVRQKKLPCANYLLSLVSSGQEGNSNKPDNFADQIRYGTLKEIYDLVFTLLPQKLGIYHLILNDFKERQEQECQEPKPKHRKQ